MRYFLLLIPASLMLLLSGCTTVEFVRKDASPVRQGILRHAPPSDAKKEQEYRKKVNEKATEYCGGAYNITKEYQAMDVARSSAGVGTGFGIGSGSSIFLGSSGPSTTMYNFVEFTCAN